MKAPTTTQGASPLGNEFSATKALRQTARVKPCCKNGRPIAWCHVQDLASPSHPTSSLHSGAVLGIASLPRGRKCSGPRLLCTQTRTETSKTVCFPSTLPGPGKNLAKQSSVILPKSQQAREVPQVVGNILKEMDYSWVGLDPLAYFYSNL